MLSNLNIIHRRKPELFLSQGAPVWTTCLRSLAFLPAERIGDLSPSDEIFHAERAYRFLLEVVCGLHSPILGETEVFGQFKIFATEWTRQHPEHAPLVQRLLSDAKAIRTKFLENLGVQSYGSWIRKNLRSSKIHVVGAGQLAREILPYLIKQAGELKIHVREPQKASHLEIGPHKHTLEQTQEHADSARGIHALEERAFTSGSLIIAAPVSAEFVQHWLNGKAPTQIFDLRDTASSDAVVSEGEHFKLADIFQEIEATKRRLEPVISSVQAEIQTCTDKVASSAIIRPNGWDDLCA